ncbi:Beta-hydroxyacid dehydrogenase, 3-hydroxyisobutyrate dehydrogenase [Corynebacterium camporealensis]|nr:Beta-hydroxyacid dehydrogenase, 3-hydroxyisobutyrate dehydrogenase [Corynebacterium camporealensis]
MKIAFLGTGRMGTELARHLLDDHDVVVWNRTAERAQPLVDAGATLASSPSEAVASADIVVSSLFGPDNVREVIVEPGLIPDGVTWIDTTTVSPDDARSFAEAVDSYVHAPVVGSLGPARDRQLGTYVARLTMTDANKPCPSSKPGLPRKSSSASRPPLLLPPASCWPTSHSPLPLRAFWKRSTSASPKASIPKSSWRCSTSPAWRYEEHEGPIRHRRAQYRPRRFHRRCPVQGLQAHGAHLHQATARGCRRHRALRRTTRNGSWRSGLLVHFVFRNKG